MVRFLPEGVRDSKRDMYISVESIKHPITQQIVFEPRIRQNLSEAGNT